MNPEQNGCNYPVSYLGVKLINAISMTRGEYNLFRGWQLPADENGADEGYLVEYLDGGKPNTEQFKGYVSWSPKEVFDNAYRHVSGLNFGLAIEALKSGKRVSRSGWNGKGMYLQFVKPPQSATPPDMRYDVTVGDEYTYMPDVKLLAWIGMKTADGCFVPWLASQTDILADDWQVF